MGDRVGARVGYRVGDGLGSGLGIKEGTCVGGKEGAGVGSSVGAGVASSVGAGFGTSTGAGTGTGAGNKVVASSSKCRWPVCDSESGILVTTNVGVAKAILIFISPDRYFMALAIGYLFESKTCCGTNATMN